MHTLLENHLLETLSFFKKMRREEILFDMDEGLLTTDLAQMTDEDLDRALSSLVRRGHLKRSKEQGEFYWIRCLPSRKKGLGKLIAKFRSSLSL